METVQKIAILSNQVIKTSVGEIKLGGKPLAVGGYGIVFPAFYGKINIAIKFFNHCDSRVNYGLAKKIFQNEIAIQSQLESAYSARIIIHGQAKISGTLFHFYVMRKAEMNLREYMQQHSQSSQNRSQLAIELVKAIVDLHMHGVVHCDVKPENILIYKNCPVICDFGIAFVTSDSLPGFKKPLSIHSTRYFAPEQAVNDLDKIGKETDLFLLGLIVYELLNKTKPSSGKSIKRSSWKIRDESFLNLCVSLTVQEAQNRKISDDILELMGMRDTINISVLYRPPGKAISFDAAALYP